MHVLLSMIVFKYVNKYHYFKSTFNGGGIHLKVYSGYSIDKHFLRIQNLTVRMSYPHKDSGDTYITCDNRFSRKKIYDDYNHYGHL